MGGRKRHPELAHPSDHGLDRDAPRSAQAIQHPEVHAVGQQRPPFDGRCEELGSELVRLLLDQKSTPTDRLLSNDADQPWVGCPSRSVAGRSQRRDTILRRRPVVAARGGRGVRAARWRRRCPAVRRPHRPSARNRVARRSRRRRALDSLLARSFPGGTVRPTLTTARLSALYGWSAKNGMVIIGVAAASASRVVPAPPWLMTTRARGSTSVWSTQRATSPPPRSPLAAGSAEPMDKLDRPNRWTRLPGTRCGAPPRRRRVPSGQTSASWASRYPASRRSTVHGPAVARVVRGV